MVTFNPSNGEDPLLIQRLGALASEASMKIIGALASHRPDPVPVRVLSAELGIERSKASRHLARLRNARLVSLHGHKRGYVNDSEEIQAVIGPKNYRRITQGIGGIAQNDDAPDNLSVN